MSTNPILMPYGGYRKLRSYRIAEVIYDATVVFCERFIPRSSRTHDQMVQAARSGVRNISEGSGAAATSASTEIRLTNVARASLGDELSEDYRSFLLQHNLSVWQKDSTFARAMRERLRIEGPPNDSTLPATGRRVRLSGLQGLPEFMKVAEPEVCANAMLCAIHQATYLLQRQINTLTAKFEREGGFRERLVARRVAARGRPSGSDPPPASDGALTRSPGAGHSHGGRLAD